MAHKIDGAGKTTTDTGGGVDKVEIKDSIFAKLVEIIDPDGAAANFSNLGGNTFPPYSPKLTTPRRR